MPNPIMDWVLNALKTGGLDPGEVAKIFDPIRRALSGEAQALANLFSGAQAQNISPTRFPITPGGVAGYEGSRTTTRPSTLEATRLQAGTSLIPGASITPTGGAYPATPGGVAGYEASRPPAVPGYMDEMAWIFFGKSYDQLTPAEQQQLHAKVQQAYGLGGTTGRPYMAELAEQQRQFDLTQQWLREQLAAQQAMEQAALAQRRREMAANLGQGIAGLQSQQWAQALPYQLPAGAQYTPGYEPGGLMSQMARQAGVRFTPAPVAESPAPTREQMEAWLADAIARFG